MKACLTVLAAVAWFVSATFWWLASRRPPPPVPVADFSADHDFGKEYDEEQRGTARRNKYAAWAAMVAAGLQCFALVVR